MKNKYKYVIVSLILLIVSLSSSAAETPLSVKKKYDSLFVIASSGEIKFKDMVQPAIDSIAAMGVDAVPLLIEEFDTKSARERVTLVNIFKKIGSPAVPDLITALGHTNSLIISRVCNTLGDIKDTTAVMPLISVRTHAKWQVRDQAVGALGDLKDKRAEVSVMEAMSDPIGQVRKAAAVSAGKIVIQQSASQLVGMLDDDFYGARMSAFDALLKLDTAHVFNVIRDSVYSKSEFVSSLSCQILGQMNTDSSLVLLAEVFENSQLSLKAHAAEALIKADPEDITGFQSTVLNDAIDLINPLLKLRIESAVKAAEDGKKESEK